MEKTGLPSTPTTIKQISTNQIAVLGCFLIRKSVINSNSAANPIGLKNCFKKLMSSPNIMNSFDKPAKYGARTAPTPPFTFPIMIQWLNFDSESV